MFHKPVKAVKTNQVTAGVGRISGVLMLCPSLEKYALTTKGVHDVHAHVFNPFYIPGDPTTKGCTIL